MGTTEDESTFHAFPSPENLCWKADPPAVVRAAYQARFCLTERYRSCPVFARQEDAPLPAKLASIEKRRAVRSGGGPQVMFFVGILLLAIITLGGWGIFIVGSSEAPPPLLLPSSTPTELASGHTPTLSPSPVPTEGPTETSTPPPEPTSPPTPGPSLDSVFGAGQQFLIHRVEAGENMGAFVEAYDTTEEVIRYVNAIEDWPLWVGELLVIPVGATEVGDLPRFSVFQVPAGGVQVAAVAELFGADVDGLRRYNQLGDSDLLPEGRWLIVPLAEG